MVFPHLCRMALLHVMVILSAYGESLLMFIECFWTFCLVRKMVFLILCDDSNNSIIFSLYRILKLRVPICPVYFFAPWEIFSRFLSSADFFSKLTHSKNSFRITIRLSNSLDPGQARHYVGPDWVQTVCTSYPQTALGDE